MFADHTVPGSAPHHSQQLGRQRARGTTQCGRDFAGSLSAATMQPVAAPRRRAIPGRHFVYLLAGRREGTLYVGVTNDFSRRIGEHEAKLVRGFSQTHGIDRLADAEMNGSVLDAGARSGESNGGGGRGRSP
jgi:predicted GIY-YIG superfamily endonuclease